MKKILILILAISFCFASIAPAFPADELIYETFDSWRNPYVAEGWETHSVGGWGGEYNQIYGAGQEITCGEGDTTYYRRIYRDFKVEPGKHYAISFGYTSMGGLQPWFEFIDSAGRVVKTVGGSFHHPANETKGFFPYIYFGYASHIVDYEQAAQAPLTAERLRVIFQGGPKSAFAVKNIIFYEAKQVRTDNWGEKGLIPVYEFYRVEGPLITRNTEFANKKTVNGWGTEVFGMRTGEFKIHAWGGSSQGISAGGTFNDYKMLYKDLKVTPGQKYKLSVDVISNSTNNAGTRDPSPVRIWVQYDDKDGRVLSTHGIDGTQAGIKDNEWTTVTVPGPSGTAHTITPAGTDHARIILQVMGGTGGGTIFDNVSFTRVE